MLGDAPRLIQRAILFDSKATDECRDDPLFVLPHQEEFGLHASLALDDARGIVARRIVGEDPTPQVDHGFAIRVAIQPNDHGCVGCKAGSRRIRQARAIGASIHGRLKGR